MKIVDVIFKVLALSALVYLCMVVPKKIDNISADNAIINEALTEQSRQACRVSISALDQLEDYIMDMSKNGDVSEKVRADKMVRRMTAHQKAMAKQGSYPTIH